MQILLPRIALPGPSYIEILRLVHRTLRPRTYVEIGVFMGESLAAVLPGARAVGIDPNPQIQYALPSGTTIHAVTSDAYFATHDTFAEFGGLPVDLAFIDGLHLFEQTLRDFTNIEKRASPASTILLHDCYPLHRRTSERAQTTTMYTGDAWRTILALRKYRPELSVHVIATHPTGLGVVRGLHPGSTTLERNFDRIVTDFLALDYGEIEADKAARLNLFPNEDNRIRELLGAALAGETADEPLERGS